MNKIEFTLRTELSVEECERRLKRETTQLAGVKSFLFPFSAGKKMICKLENHRFELRKRPFPLQNDHSSLRCYGELVPDVSGTRIEAEYSLPTFGKWYFTIWSVVATVIGVPMLLLGIANRLSGVHTDNDWLFFAVPTALMTFGWSVVLLPPRFSPRRKYYLSFLKTTFEADEVEAI
jgi:hypothetical protein